MKKSKYSYIGIAAVILVFGAYVIRNIDRRSGDNNIVEDNRLNNVEKPSKESGLYSFHKVPNFEFINQVGDTINNKSYEGKVYVLEFFFTTCPTICPIMNQKMLTLQDAFKNKEDFGIASISITPQIDTPKILQSYADKHGITHPNWHLLTGKPSDQVFSLANSGFKLYAGLGDEQHGGFEHSGLFALIDKKGVIRSRVDEHGNPIMYYRALKESGFPDQIHELKEDIKLLLDE